MTEHRTKARTRGAKRAGRKRRQDVPREPNGRVAERVQIADRGPTVHEELKWQMAIRFGLTVEQIETGMTGNKDITGMGMTAVYALWLRDLLGHKGGVGEKRKTALEDYRTLYVNWSAMTGSRRWKPDQKPAGMGLTEEAWRACDDKMAACDGALQRLPGGDNIRDALAEICLEDAIPCDLIPPEGARNNVNETAFSGLKVIRAIRLGADTVGAVLSARKIPERVRPSFEDKWAVFDSVIRNRGASPG